MNTLQILVFITFFESVFYGNGVCILLNCIIKVKCYFYILKFNIFHFI